MPITRTIIMQKDRRRLCFKKKKLTNGILRQFKGTLNDYGLNSVKQQFRYLLEGHLHHGEIMKACAICAHGRPQGHYQVGEGHQTQQVQKYVQEMSLAPIGNPAERQKKDGKL